MDPQIEQLLASTNPNERQRAIRALAKGPANEAVLRQLVAIYKTDPDPDVRQLALAAGKRLKRQGASPSKRTTTTTAAISERRAQRGGASSAQALLEDVVGMVVMGDYDNARDSARRAYEHDPSIIENDRNLKIIASAFEMPVREALAELGVGVGGRKPKRKRGKEKDELTFLDGLVYLLLYGAYTIVPFLILIGIMLFVDPNLADVLETATARNVLFVTGVQGLLLASLIVITFYFVLNFVLHIVATLVFSGDGSLPALLRELNLPMLVYSLLTFVPIIIFLLTPNAIQALNTGVVPNDASAALLAVPNIASFVLLCYYPFALNRTYDYGVDRGCFTMIFPIMLGPCAVCVAIVVSGSMDLGGAMLGL